MIADLGHDTVREGTIFQSQILLWVVTHEDAFEQRHLWVVGERNWPDTKALSQFLQPGAFEVNLAAGDWTGDDQSRFGAEPEHFGLLCGSGIRLIPLSLFLRPWSRRNPGFFHERKRALNILVVQAGHHDQAVGQRPYAQAAELRYTSATIHQDVIVRCWQSWLEGFETERSVGKPLRLEIVVQNAAQSDQLVLGKPLDTHLCPTAPVILIAICYDDIEPPKLAHLRAQGRQLLIGHRPDVIGDGRQV